MSVRARIPYAFGFLAILGGLLLLASTQVATVLPDPQRTELSGLQQGNLISDVTGVILSALLITFGAVVILARASRAPTLTKSIALAIVASALPVFLFLQTLLVINGVAASSGGERTIFFSASYFFHTGGDLAFASVYMLFFFTLALVFLLLGSVGYLLAPRRFGLALFDRFSWNKNEAIHVAATLVLVLSLTVLCVNLFRLAVETPAGALQGRGLMAENLVALYFLLSILLFALILVIAAHTFLLNWGIHGSIEFGRLVESVRTIARVERGLLAAAAVVDLLILIGPELPSQLQLSHSFVFSVSPRGLGYAFFLMILAYVPYALTERRLDFLLRAGKGPRSSGPFADRSLRIVLAGSAGLVILTALGVAGRWDPLGLMLAFSVWVAGVLLVNSVRVEAGRGLPRLAFLGESGPAFYFVFLGLALTIGLMLWGSGNTFEVGYQPAINQLQVFNESSYGTDIFARLGAAVLVASVLILTMDLWLETARVDRRYLAHYLAVFLAFTITTLFVFTVGVWTRGDGLGIEDANAGFSFHQYDGPEPMAALVMLGGTVLYFFWAFGKMIRPVLERGHEAVVGKTVTVQWR